MPGGKLQAKRYSQAIFEIAEERKTFDKWSEDLNNIASLLQNPELSAIIDNPRFSFENKFKLISASLQSTDPLVLNLVKLLIGRGNFGLITDIYSEYSGLLDSYRQIEKAEVTTAIPLEENEKVDIIKRLETLTGKKINLTVKVDSSILGGMIIRIGGKLLDGSTNTRLAFLRNEMGGAES